MLQAVWKFEFHKSVFKKLTSAVLNGLRLLIFLPIRADLLWTLHYETPSIRGLCGVSWGLPPELSLTGHTFSRRIFFFIIMNDKMQFAYCSAHCSTSQFAFWWIACMHLVPSNDPLVTMVFSNDYVTISIVEFKWIIKTIIKLACNKETLWGFLGASSRTLIDRWHVIYFTHFTKDLQNFFFIIMNDKMQFAYCSAHCNTSQFAFWWIVCMHLVPILPFSNYSVF